MKKLLSFILLFSLLFTFCACGGDDDKEEPEQFVWGGDWNDPDDPNYKPEYEGKYNPIQGLWKRMSDETIGCYFSEDFIGYVVYFYPHGGYTKDGPREYEINDKAYRYSRAAPDVVRYKVVGDRLYLGSVSAHDDELAAFSRVIGE